MTHTEGNATIVRELSERLTSHTYPTIPGFVPAPSPTLVGAVTLLPLVSTFRFVHEPVASPDAERFVGRQHELNAFVERVLFSNGGSFLVTGYRGVGKTSFIHQALRKLEDAVATRPSSAGKRTEIVAIHLNIARPVQPAELMHYIVRRLHDRLAELQILPKLDAVTRDALEQAYERTSFNMARKLSESSERSFGVTDAGLTSKALGVAAKLSWNAKRSHTNNYEKTFLGYDDRAAEHDIITISRRLREGYVAAPSRWSRIMRALGREMHGGARTELKIVFVFDELDKLEEFSTGTDANRKPIIDEILGALKNLFTTSGVTFVFVAGKDLQERWLEDVGQGDSVYESVFSYDKYLPCMWRETNAICDHLVDKNATGNWSTFDKFRAFLAYKGRGIPRRIVRTFNEYVTWYGERPMLAFTRKQLDRVKFFAGLQAALESNSQVVFGDTREEGTGTQSDKRRLGVYYLVDWMMRQGGEFTLSDVAKASRKLSAKIALAEEIAPRVIEDLIRTLVASEYLMEVPVNLDRVLIGEPVANAEKKYVIPPRRVIEMGGNGDELEEDSRLLSTLGSSERRVPALVAIGKYTLLETIGTGGMGIVYRATDMQLGGVAAIKTLRGETIGNVDVVERFLREARLMRELSHPNIVRFIEAGTIEADGRPFIAMEYLDGLTLETILGTLGKLPLEVTVQVMQQVTDAVQYLHEQGIVRNDLKPANVVITARGRVRLFDFGISRYADDAEQASNNLTITGLIIGTPRYMAPEQWQGAAADARSDIYALGVMLYQLLTRVYPFPGEQPGEIFAAQATTPVVAPSTYAPLPPAVDAVVLRCLELEPTRRFASSAELSAALVEAAGGATPVDLRELVTRARERSAALEQWGNEVTETSFTQMFGAPPTPAVQVPSEAPEATVRLSPASIRPAPAAPAAPAAPTSPSRAALPPPVAATASGRPAILPLDAPATFLFSLVPDGDAFLLKATVTTVGRAADNDIVLLNPLVSRYHGRFVVNGDVCSFEPFGSKHGVLVNGSTVDAALALRNGDEITIGSNRFLFRQ